MNCDRITCDAHKFYIKNVLQMSAGSDLADHVWKEDGWLGIIRSSHHLFCDCGSWLQHLNDLLILHHGPQWAGDLATKEDNAAHGEGEGWESAEGPTDAELLDALRDAENGAAAGEGTKE